MNISDALGVIFANEHDYSVPEITGKRTMASMPFAGRYRMIDFQLSCMVNAGIKNVGVLVRRNYQSLMDHLGNGREWDLSRKIGGLSIFPPSDNESGEYMRLRHKLEMLSEIMGFLTHHKEEFVVMCECNIAYNMDFKELIRHHKESGADVTVAYEKAALHPAMRQDNVVLKFSANKRIKELRINDYQSGVQNLSMNVYVMKRELLVNVIKDSLVSGLSSFKRDFLLPSLKTMRILGYEHTGYRARIFNMQSYFKANLSLLDENVLAQLFPENQPIYTKVRDNPPVLYNIGANVKNSMLADGCVIQGEVENCVLFRDVHVGKGAKLKNCIVMQGSRIGENASIAYMVTDKNVTIMPNKIISGAESYPLFIAKGVCVE